MTAIDFNHDFSFEYGLVTLVAPKIRRIVANNPGPYTGPGTSTYIIGDDDVAVIDPGPLLPQHIDALIDGLGSTRISHILVTHTHNDHSPGAKLLKHHTGAPTFGFSPHSQNSAGALEGGVDRDFIPDFAVKNGEILEGTDWSLEAIHTPGHCSNHLCFAFLGQDSLFCGDQLMAWSTPVIMPPDGSVSDYLMSLETLFKRDESIFYPTHGRPIDSPQTYAKQVIEHRLHRVEQIKNAIEKGINTIPAMCDAIYPNIPPILFAGAELSVLASLEYLMQKELVLSIESSPLQYRLKQ